MAWRGCGAVRCGVSINHACHVMPSLPLPAEHTQDIDSPQRPVMVAGTFFLMLGREARAGARRLVPVHVLAPVPVDAGTGVAEADNPFRYPILSAGIALLLHALAPVLRHPHPRAPATPPTDRAVRVTAPQTTVI